MQFTHFHVLDLKASLLNSESVSLSAPTLSQRLGLEVLGSKALAANTVSLGETINSVK